LASSDLGKAPLGDTGLVKEDGHPAASDATTAAAAVIHPVPQEELFARYAGVSGRAEMGNPQVPAYVVRQLEDRGITARRSLHGFEHMRSSSPRRRRLPRALGERTCGLANNAGWCNEYGR
jgi:hypothetical protein